jgi:glutamate N-acetyltransferase/amino-acid N-acetyltransferase
MPSLKRSPLAPKRPPTLAPVQGVRLATTAAGIRYVGRTDLLLAVMPHGTPVGGVVTTSRSASAPVKWCQAGIRDGRARALVVNSGNSNTFTGKRGVATVRATAATAAKLAGCRPDQVFVASTGVIGEPPDSTKITNALPGLYAALKPGAWGAAAEAIRTTDTFAKAAGATARIAEARVRIAGIAKGSGMIAPNMATMLSFIFTDAAIPPTALQRMVAAMADRTFNAITVDSDTSTSDTVLVFATGAVRHPRVVSATAPLLADFRAKLEGVMRDLAHQIVKDGEGAQKFIAITVAGAKSDASARRIGMTVANSPLVKTAIAGGDPNWGRIVMAVGKAGEPVRVDKLSIAMGGIPIARRGEIVKGYSDARVARYLQGRDVTIAIDVAVGRGSATVWTCDLTHGYININASYKT